MGIMSGLQAGELGTEDTKENSVYGGGDLDQNDRDLILLVPTLQQDCMMDGGGGYHTMLCNITGLDRSKSLENNNEEVNNQSPYTTAILEYCKNKVTNDK